MTLQLNNLPVPEIVQGSMTRPDWALNSSTNTWLERFITPELVEFRGLEMARDNEDPYSAAGMIEPLVHGAPNTEDPPGNNHPTQCFVIGFVDMFDGTIEVDYRPGEPRRTAVDYHHNGQKNFTVSETLGEFEDFFMEHARDH